jgi:hypothetical protein
MYGFQNYSPGMWLYLFLHGSYGISWVIKDCIFPDKKVLQPASVGSQCLLCFILLAYWMIPVPLAAGYGISSPSPVRLAFLITLYLCGLLLMMGADYQKSITLKRRKGITFPIKDWSRVDSSSTLVTPTTWERSSSTPPSCSVRGTV